MARIFIIIILATLGMASARAQKGLEVAPFFSERSAENPNVTLISMSAEQLSSRGLSKYKSITVENDSNLADRIAVAVASDGSKAVEKEVSYKKGELYLGFYYLGGSGDRRRYLMYLNRRPTGREKVTLIYLEGELGPDAVKRIVIGK